MRSTANKSTTPRMIPSWQSRNFAWSGCMITIIGIENQLGSALTAGGLFMLEHFFKSLVATVSDPYQCNRITDALAAAGIKFYCKSKDVNRHNTFDQARIGTLGIKPKYVTEVFVDKENADMALHIIHTLS